jgi:EAL domain-containing protein (putative c-di-GMP-specific phosphodiesterase class I)
MEERARTLSRDLPEALARHEIHPFFQPQFAGGSTAIVAAEALARWEHPQLGWVPPTEFIAIAESSGDIAGVGTWITQVACRAAELWQKAGLAIDVSVNVSPVQLRDDDFVNELWDFIQSQSLDASRVTLEVTESTPISDVQLAAAPLQAMADLGFGISIDDFGAGHWSTDQVRQLPATELKIDRSVIADDSTEGRRRLAEIVAFAEDQQLRTVAEGVETTSQLERVREHSIDRVQGFLLGHPLPRIEFDRLLAHSPR